MLTKQWYDRIPHAVTILFMIIVFVTLLTYILPAGEFKRELIEGRSRVIPGSYSTIPNTPIGFLEMFKAIPLCDPLVHFFTSPPAAVTATCMPQHIAKSLFIFF